jgi:hypothetical protein
VQQLKNRSLHVRLVHHEENVHDFCFLKKAQKELVGGARSTFVDWAAYLGNASVSRLYTLDSLGLRNRFGDEWIRRQNINFTNTELKNRIRFELYRSEEMDALVERGAKDVIPFGR